MIILSLIACIIGYVVALNLSLLTQVITFGGVCFLVSRSRDYRNAEIGQLLYMWVAFMALIGACIGNGVYFVAHRQDPNLTSGWVWNGLVQLFTP